MMTNSKPTHKWNMIDWKIIELWVFNIQRKIYDYTKIGNNKAAKILQNKLIRSKYAKLLAIRKVTQDNRGKNTAGIDGIKSLSQSERINLVKQIKIDGSASKIRRVFIPKADGTQRPLGIPTITDRCKQMLVKFALEPQWEAKFEANSYGFRPGYAVADAKRTATRQIQGKPKFVLDADIKGCFDNINHETLLNKLDTTPMIANQIKSWLKAGVMEKFEAVKTMEREKAQNERGTPQGGVISPLLCNIALHGLEKAVVSAFPRDGVKLVRYADDFLVFSSKLEYINKARIIIVAFLETVGLELSETKTRIAHSMDQHDGSNIGFNFLGFHFRNIKCSIHRGVKSTKGKKMPFQQTSMPSLAAIKAHKGNIKEILKKYKDAPLTAVVSRLSASIQGWTRYFSISKSTRCFSYIDSWLFPRLWNWAKKRFKTAKNAKKQCFSVQNWQFGFTQKGKIYILKRHDQTKVQKYVKIKAYASIYDGKLEYFFERMSMHNARIARLRKVMVKQKHECAYCKLRFFPNDIIELHHVLNENGIPSQELQFVHGHCHDALHGSN